MFSMSSSMILRIFEYAWRSAEPLGRGLPTAGLESGWRAILGLSQCPRPRYRAGWSARPASPTRGLPVAFQLALSEVDSLELALAAVVCRFGDELAR